MIKLIGHTDLKILRELIDRFGATPLAALERRQIEAYFQASYRGAAPRRPGCYCPAKAS